MADERDSNLSQHYRQLEALEPPAELDRRILAAARQREGAHAPLVVPAGRHRWYYSLAAAAVLVLAVAVTLHVDRDRPDPEATATTPAPQAEKSYSENKAGGRIEYAPDPKAQAAPADPSPRRDMAEPPPPPAARAARKEEKQLEAAARPRSAAPAAPSPQTQMKDEARPRQDAREARGAEAAVAPDRVGELSSAMKRSAPAAAPPAPPAAAPPERPERWLERIAELRSRGRHAEADRELAEFRRVYPKFPISEVMRERIEGR